MSLDPAHRPLCCTLSSLVSFVYPRRHHCATSSLRQGRVERPLLRLLTDLIGHGMLVQCEEASVAKRPAGWPPTDGLGLQMVDEIRRSGRNCPDFFEGIKDLSQLVSLYYSILMNLGFTESSPNCTETRISDRGVDMCRNGRIDLQAS